MEDVVAIVGIFIAFPIILFHYITKWKTAKTLTGSDEKLLDDLYELSRRLDDRMCTIERIMSAENPNWRQTCLPGADDELNALRSRMLSGSDR
ncbi:envelope stress response membrane protein PspB [Sphingomonas sp. LY160]|uniref:envelope stress response membrane protein PspB n=1 Tax=Sphingomonas sp. LY160 TaxID=3095342 RepID=UPI002ADEF36D|nr:envelope stress response membrane protein PspB [Sphingomonas sp. LY160]MEA1071273.1 envelope stress response membrane protein PspB [Sphingomonas sp. LY160]